MINRLIYIDVENVGIGEVRKTEKLQRTDKIILFVNEAEKTLRTNICYELTKVQAATEILTFRSREKNALDFNICSSIGMQADKSKEIYIVSKDKGYRSAAEFFQNNGINIHLVSDLNQLIPENELQTTQERQTIKEALSSAGIQLSTTKQIKRCEQIIRESPDKNILHNTLQDAFQKTINTSKLYKCLLPVFQEYKEAHA